jgi:hypothetical protein
VRHTTGLVTPVLITVIFPEVVNGPAWIIEYLSKYIKPTLVTVPDTVLLETAVNSTTDTSCSGESCDLSQ